MCLKPTGKIIFRFQNVLVGAWKLPSNDRQRTG